ncbi:MAG TPA: cytochrome c-type biogenesis protein [Steroidobacteraceae bacterium]|nr:cytochrome c-type biogenesis protein [Steroidobacteraceae bacterium]
MSRPWLRALAAWGVLCLLWTVSLPAPAVDTEPALPSAALQRRYENLTHQLRCLVCQDETIADSSASLAADFRALVHQQLLQGRSDAQIKAFMVARYGDYILLQPPVRPLTWLLWSGPFLLILGGALWVVRTARRHARLPDAQQPMPEGDWE